MQRFLALLIVIISAFSGLLLIEVSAESSTSVTQSATLPPPPVRDIALVGDATEVGEVALPFVSNGSLDFLRTYPNPAIYLDESAAPPFGGAYPPNLTLRLYRVTTDTIFAGNVISKVVDTVDTFAEVESIIVNSKAWLSFVPRQIVLHGNCSSITIEADLHNLQMIKVMPLTYPSVPTGSCINLYRITDGMRVLDKMVAINGGPPVPPPYPLVQAEPNYLTVGYPSNHYVVGSPAGMVPGASTTSTPPSDLTTSGKNVLVYIFDTSPYTNGQPSQTEIVNGVAISVTDNFSLPAVLPANPFNFVDAHGTFVATPFTDLAYNSHIRLLRTLNDDGMGDVYSLYEAMDSAANNALLIGDNARGVIFNYSLGLEVIDVLESTTALARLVGVMNQLDIIQVAAAGNSSGYTNNPQPMTLPASHQDVIGVTATTINNALACYANQGDIATLGGGIDRGSGDCNPAQIVFDCRNNNSPYCVSGWDPDASTGYAYGIGTSFASPLVAAVAAQWVELLAPRSAGGNWVPHDIVRDEIYAMAEAASDPAMGVGILLPQEAPTAVSVGAVSAETPAPLPLLIIFCIVCAVCSLQFRQQTHKN